MSRRQGTEVFPVSECDKATGNVRGLVNTRLGAGELFVTRASGLVLALTGFVEPARDQAQPELLDYARVEVLVRTSLEAGETLASVAILGADIEVYREYSLDEAIPAVEGLSEETAEQDSLVQVALATATFTGVGASNDYVY